MCAITDGNLQFFRQGLTGGQLVDCGIIVMQRVGIGQLPLRVNGKLKAAVRRVNGLHSTNHAVGAVCLLLSGKNECAVAIGNRICVGQRGMIISIRAGGIA